MLIVDSREFKSKVVKELFNNDVEMQSLQLEVGDYLIGESICVERKSVTDFVDSLVDKRIFEQLSSMKKSYKKPVLIIEGGESIFSARKVHPNAIRGLINTVIIDYNIPIIFSKDEADTAAYIISLVNRSDKTPSPVSKKIKNFQMSDIQESIIESIPGIGAKAGNKILSHFKTVKKVFNAEIKEIMEVEGVGEKTAKEIHNIANCEYKN